MATIGYLQGVDPLVLTRLAILGVGTLPISNGFDNHGKFINAITERDGIDIIIGHLHKILRTQRQGFYAEDILQACFDCRLLIVVIVPQADHEAARRLLGTVGNMVILVDPDHLYDEVVGRLDLA